MRAVRGSVQLLQGNCSRVNRLPGVGGDQNVATSSEAERLRQIAREVRAEADLSDPAEEEKAEAYERLAEAADGEHPVSANGIEADGD
jgi:hypothetical protein